MTIQYLQKNHATFNEFTQMKELEYMICYTHKQANILTCRKGGGGDNQRHYILSPFDTNIF